jgi:hypothetical protein
MSEIHESTGIIEVISDEVTRNEKYKSREFILKQPGEFDQYIKFETKGLKCERLNSLHVGQEVKVTYSVKGRKWEKDGKIGYFNSLEAWKIESTNGQKMTVYAKDEIDFNKPIEPRPTVEPEPYNFDPNGQTNDDLPFN